MVLADHHCHISKEYFDNPLEEIESLKQDSGLEYICAMGVNYENDLEYLEYKRLLKDNFLKIGLGLHPSDVIELGRYSINEFERIEKLIRENIELVDYIGEIGIDFTYPDAEKFREEQVEVFKSFCKLAKSLKLAVSIHARNSISEVIQVVDEVYDDTEGFKGFWHCFTGTFEEGKFFIEKGFKLGINGIITFKKSEDLRKTIKDLLNFYIDKDFDDLFGLETDTPYLTPEPKRREKNSPRNIEIIKEALRQLANNKE